MRTREPVLCWTMIAGFLASLVLAAPDATTEDRFQTFGEFVIDTATGFQWLVGPDRDLDWAQARDWVDSLGNGWRMPSIDELEDLYEAGVSADSRGPFVCGGELVWADSPAAWDFLYGGGVGYSTGMEPSAGHRVFAVSVPILIKEH
ncbi:MAG: hypothetical protein AVO35_11965 [Candidatus Aegiribacteria sp. MLS_C]|nr:MAG: hypothetical protein AVO35_11965 [Candidatus Aegiribacteria sp. MLS_C]